MAVFPLCFLVLSALAGASAQAPAPAPTVAERPAASGAFILSAASAVFQNSSTLVFAGVPATTEWIAYPPHPNAGGLTQHRLTSSYLYARDGSWAGKPQAVLSGQYNGAPSSVLLQLNTPTYSPSSNTMTFQYKALSDNVTALPVSGGIVNTYATRMVSASNNHNATLAQVTPGITFYAANLVIDVAGIEMYTTNVMARTEDGLIHVDLGEDNLYYYGR